MSLDFGLLRRDAVPKGLSTKPLGQIEYALYAPLELVPRGAVLSLAWALENLPVATQTSDGRFHRYLEEVAATAGARLNVTLECESFPQALRALQTRAYAAILPRVAVRDMDVARIVEIPSPELQSERRPIVLAWNPRTLRLRHGAEQLCRGLAEYCRC